jgi:hypothetical protein
MLLDDAGEEEEHTKERRVRMEVKIQKAVEIIRAKKGGRGGEVKAAGAEAAT